MAAPLVVAALGCSFEEGVDAHVPGNDLGVFQVSATLDSSTCGPGALGAPDVWEFEVQLSRLGEDFYWLNGFEAIPGRVDTDGAFSLVSRTETELEPPAPGLAGCTILRDDQAEGSLEGDDRDVPSFTAEMRYAYTPGVESDCSPYVGIEGGFAVLPCDLRYELEGVRTVEPRSAVAE